ncbi:MAG: T9SS type A sorting domain-containing protein [Bacteroidota bacterium]
MHSPLSDYTGKWQLLLVTLVLLPWLSLIPIDGSALRYDTTYSVSFQLNMSKAVQQHIFNPDSDYVYVIMDQGIAPMKLVPGPDYNYSCTLFNELDSGVTYHYKFRINDAVWETVNRSVTAVPGMVYVKAWWNNDALNYTRFVVNMFYAEQSGWFNPATDSVCIVGSMNNMQGSPAMQRIDTSLVYSFIYSLDPGSVQQYKYRINADSSGLELMNKPSRLLLVPDTLIEVQADFNNYNPGKRPMTFSCNMGYYTKAHHFDPAHDWIDVAGNFNGWGAHDILFSRTGDTVYTFQTLMDTTWFSSGPLLFKFRINGDWTTSELAGKPNRNYTLHDTVNANPNIFSCYYNDLNPHVLAPPWVYDVSIQGILINHQIVTGMYTYENVNGIPESNSSYQWYRSTDPEGLNLLPIDTAWRINYTIDTLDIGRWLVFEVTPKAASGDSALGKPVRVVSATSIGGVGINELSLISRIYPNPTSEFLSVEAGKILGRIEITSLEGKLMMVIRQPESRAVRIQVESLPKGIYLLRAFAAEGGSGVAKFIRQ